MAASDNKIFYTQDDVFVHTAVPSSTLHDNIIRGSLHIIQELDGTFIEWKPLDEMNADIQYEIHGELEYGIVTQQPNTTICDGNFSKIHFDVEDIKSIRRSDPRLWSYVQFQLKTEVKLPALHFHGGGIEKMISTLQRFIWVTKSPANDKVFIVKEKDDALDSALNHFELFPDSPTDSITRLFNSTVYETLSKFSKVPYFMLGLGGINDLQEKRPGKVEEEGDAFEILDTEQDDDVEPVILVSRGQPLQPEEWCTFMENDGVIRNIDTLKDRIFRGGIHKDIRSEAWKFLLGYNKFESSFEERNVEAEKLRECYERMKLQWLSISKEQEQKFFEFQKRKHLIEKDAHRTDRTLDYFKGDGNENIKKLTNILMTYCMYNFDLGYVQGMSDLLSTILRLVDDEVMSFWCFVGFMGMEEKLFEVSQDLMKNQLLLLGKLIKFLYPRFWEYLERREADNLYFCFRWILISFKREFNNEDIMTLWEALWTQRLSPHFKLFVCLAILEKEKGEMMRKKYDFNDILKHVNRLSGNIDLNITLSRAESICLQLQQKTDLPDDIEALIYHKNMINTTDELEGNEGNSSLGENCSKSDDAVVEISETTQSVF